MKPAPVSNLKFAACFAWLVALIVSTTVFTPFTMIIVLVAVPGVVLTFEGIELYERRNKR